MLRGDAGAGSTDPATTQSAQHSSTDGSAALDAEADKAADRGEVLGIARGGGLNLVGATYNQILRFLITLLLARLLGRTEAGLYFQAYAFLALLGILATGGFTQSLTRFVAVSRADSDSGALRGSVRFGLVFVTLAAIGLGALLYAAAPWLANTAFNDPRLTSLLRFVAVSLPPTVFADTALAATQGFKTMRHYARVGLFFEPTLRILLTIALLMGGWGLQGAMAALLVTNLLSAFLAARALRRLMGRPTVAPHFNPRELLSFSAASWMSQLASGGLLWADTILLGLYGSPADVGVYQVATRLTLLATTPIGPVGTSFAPRVADLYRRREYAALRRTYALVTSWIIRIAIPAFIFLMVFPSHLLDLFGPGFSAGASVTVILAFGQLANAATGPCGYMLIMSGRPIMQMASNLTILTLNVGLNIWLIPRYGIVGAAVAWAASIALGNVFRVVGVWLTMSMWPFGPGSLKGLLAGGGAFLAGWGVRATLDGNFALIVGAVAILATYVSMLAALGLGPDDRLVLTTLRRRVSGKKAG